MQSISQYFNDLTCTAFQHFLPIIIFFFLFFGGIIYVNFLHNLLVEYYLFSFSISVNFSVCFLNMKIVYHFICGSRWPLMVIFGH